MVNEMTTTLNFTTSPGHQVLATAGKKILRPGGKAAKEHVAPSPLTN